MTVQEAWDELLDATPRGWYVGTPAYNGRRGEWSMYAYDTAEKAHIGKRSREWTAVQPTQEGVVREMARCLREIAAGRVPK